MPLNEFNYRLINIYNTGHWPIESHALNEEASTRGNRYIPESGYKISCFTWLVLLRLLERVL